MDSLKEQVSNLTLYDIKAGVRKVQNGKPSRVAYLLILWYVFVNELLSTAVMNYTEMESKVCRCRCSLSSVPPPIPEFPSLSICLMEECEIFD